MKIEVVYIYPVSAGEKHVQYAWRFLNSYHEKPAGIDHDSVLVCNGGTPDETVELFKTMQNPRIFLHDDSGWDIGAFQAVARGSTADMMVFLGGTSYCRHAGWLKRMAEAFVKHGPAALYGVTANQGDPRFNVFPHIRTTGFSTSPSLLNRYPTKVTRLDQRYPFEHGPNCLTQWVRNQRLKALVVTQQGEYEFPNWDSIPNGYHRGNQSNVLLGDRMTEPPFYPTP